MPSPSHPYSPKSDNHSTASYSTRASAQTTTTSRSVTTNNGNLNNNSNGNGGVDNGSALPANGRNINATVSARAARLAGTSSKMHKAEAMARFHPKMITAQILSLQCFMYLAQSILIQLNYLVFATPTSVDRIFTSKYLHIWKREGVADCFMMLFAALFGAVGLVLIVEKSKKCLDFTTTYFILHLLLSTIYGGFPATLDWWIVHILSLLVMVVLGEYLCSLKELEMIPLLQF